MTAPEAKGSCSVLVQVIRAGPFWNGHVWAQGVHWVGLNALAVGNCLRWGHSRLFSQDGYGGKDDCDSLYIGLFSQTVQRVRPSSAAVFDQLTVYISAACLGCQHIEGTHDARRVQVDLAADLSVYNVRTQH